MSEDTNLYLYNFGRSCMQSFMGFYSCICSGLAAGRLCKVLDLLNIYLHRGRNFGKKVKAAPTEEKEEECLNFSAIEHVNGIKSGIVIPNYLFCVQIRVITRNREQLNS